MNDADPAGIEPTWSPPCNSAYRFKDGAKEWASHFKTTPGPNFMRVAVWPDGIEWEVPGVLFEKPQADPPEPAGVGKKLSKTEKSQTETSTCSCGNFSCPQEVQGHGRDHHEGGRRGLRPANAPQDSEEAARRHLSCEVAASAIVADHTAKVSEMRRTSSPMA